MRFRPARRDDWPALLFQLLNRRGSLLGDLCDFRRNERAEKARLCDSCRAKHKTRFGHHLPAGRLVLTGMGFVGSFTILQEVIQLHNVL